MAASRAPSVLLFAAALVAVALAAQRCVRRLGWSSDRPGASIRPSAWSVALVSFATSPIVAEHAVLCMLELLAVAGAGAVLLVLAPSVGHHPSLDVKPARRERDRGIAAGVLVAVFGIGLEYSFGLIEVLPLGAATLGTRWSRAAWRPRAWRVVCALALSILGFAAWLSVTVRSEVQYFFFGHPSYAPMISAENLQFYPRAWLQSYFVSPPIAVAVFLLAALGAFVGWRSAAVRFATFLIAVSWAMLTASTTNEARHGILMVPSASLLASVGLAWSASRLSVSSTLSRRVAAVAWEALVLASAVGWLITLPTTVRAALEGLPEYDAIEVFVSRRVDPTTPILANGLFDQIGLDGLRWRLGRDHGDRVAVGSIRIGRYPADAGAAVMGARRGFAVDPLWADRELAGQPFDDVARSGRFRHVVQIVDRAGELPNPDWAEVAATCEPARAGRLDLGRWTVLVADLSRLPKGHPS